MILDRYAKITPMDDKDSPLVDIRESHFKFLRDQNANK